MAQTQTALITKTPSTSGAPTPRQPIALTDLQITSIMQLARPLTPPQRAMFLELLAAKLNGRREIGDGALFRLCRELVREAFSPPPERQHFGKYGR
jgi:hypothetical protein